MANNLKVAYLAAGAAGMYCGSCMRDNRLAATLIQQGHDVVLIPTYTPLRTDEPGVSTTPVYYGGINVYLQSRFSLFRKLPSFLTRVLDAPGLLRTVSRFASSTRPEDLGELTVAVLQGDHGPQKKELVKLVEALRHIQPSLINLPNLMFGGIARTLRDELNVPVVCTLAGEDLFLDALPEPHRSHARNLIRETAQFIDAFVSPTKYYAAHSAKTFELHRERIHWIPLGVNPPTTDRAVRPANRTLNIGYLARICPEKGLAALCHALMKLHDAGRECRVRAAGYLGKNDRDYLKRIERFIARRGLAGAFEYVGEVDLDGKHAFLNSLDILSVPTIYHESKGTYVLEAMATGLPVVQPNIGAFPEFIHATGGGLTYNAHDDDALANTLARLMDDDALRTQLGQSGAEGVRRLFTSEIMARETWNLYEKLCRGETVQSNVEFAPD